MSRLDKLKEFLAEDPNDSFTRYAIGLEYASMKQPAEAIIALEQLRASAPEYVPTYYQLAALYRETGDRPAARTIYDVGIVQARYAKDLHAMSELQAALDEMDDEE